jgi:hypothetical protein
VSPSCSARGGPCSLPVGPSGGRSQPFSGAEYEVSADGQRFLFNLRAEPSEGVVCRAERVAALEAVITDHQIPGTSRFVRAA